MGEQSGNGWTLIVFLAILASQALASTDDPDVRALRNLYWNLNLPLELKGWRMEGGDPCEESWTGISCHDSSVIHLKLRGLNLTGSLGHQLSDLHNLKQMDVSFNKIWGPIPDELPPNATHINLACNNLTRNLPHSLSNLKYLRHLNLSHNFLSGPVGSVFTGLRNLREMDLSHNTFTGDLPSSFGTLTNLTGLFLQNNNFTGSVMYLSELPLIDLNIQNNYFSGIIPNHFKLIPNTWIGGNRFHGGNSSPWDFPLETVPLEQNISSPPKTQSSAIERTFKPKKKSMGPGRIAFMVGGGIMISCFLIQLLQNEEGQQDNPNPAQVQARNYPCGMCDGSFTKETAREEHRRRVHKKDRSRCPVCLRKLVSNQYLNHLCV